MDIKQCLVPLLFQCIIFKAFSSNTGSLMHRAVTGVPWAHWWNSLLFSLLEHPSPALPKLKSLPRCDPCHGQWSAEEPGCVHVGLLWKSSWSCVQKWNKAKVNVSSIDNSPTMGTEKRTWAAVKNHLSVSPPWRLWVCNSMDSSSQHWARMQENRSRGTQSRALQLRTGRVTVAVKSGQHRCLADYTYCSGRLCRLI